MPQPRVVIVFALVLAACSSKEAAPSKGGASEAAGSAVATKVATSPAAARYFEFTVDGKPFSVAPDDISSSFRTNGGQPEFKIFAGKDGSPGITLTVPGPMTGPSGTPNGAADIASGISQGSVSLQAFPEAGYATNSFNAIYPEMAVVVPDAVVITAIDADGPDAKIITGTFNAKTWGTHSAGTPDPKDTDHQVQGKFRLRHEFTSMSGDRF